MPLETEFGAALLGVLKEPSKFTDQLLVGAFDLIGDNFPVDVFFVDCCLTHIL
jgi:hypothetical protein